MLLLTIGCSGGDGGPCEGSTVALSGVPEAEWPAFLVAGVSVLDSLAGTWSAVAINGDGDTDALGLTISAGSPSDGSWWKRSECGDEDLDSAVVPITAEVVWIGLGHSLAGEATLYDEFAAVDVQVNDDSVWLSVLAEDATPLSGRLTVLVSAESGTTNRTSWTGEDSEAWDLSGFERVSE